MTVDARLRRAPGRWRHAHAPRSPAPGWRCTSPPALARHEHHDRRPLRDQVAAVCCGIWDGAPVLDLDYEEDSDAEADANFVLTGAGGMVEVQGTAEGEPFSESRAAGCCACARGHDELFARQRRALGWTDRRGASRAAGSSSPRHNAGKLREVAALLAPMGSSASPPARSACRSPRRRGELPRQCAASRRWPRRARPGCRRWPMTAASRSRRWTARPACAPPIGPTAGRVARLRGGDGEGRGARAGSDAARPRAWFTCALVLAWPDGQRKASRARAWPVGVAAARRAGLRLRSDVRAGRHAETFGEMDPALKHAHQPPRAGLRAASGPACRRRRRRSSDVPHSLRRTAGWKLARAKPEARPCAWQASTSRTCSPGPRRSTRGLARTAAKCP